MIREICPACEAYRLSEKHSKDAQHTCNIKNLPEIGVGELMVYNYTKPVFFLFEQYAPGSFLKCLPETTSHFLETGKESSTIFSHTVCRKASEGETIEYKEMVKRSRFVKKGSQTAILAENLCYG